MSENKYYVTINNDTINDYQKLRECPFCGGRAHLVEVPNLWCCVACEDCHSTGKIFELSMNYSAKHKAIEAWNRRASNERL